MRTARGFLAIPLLMAASAALASGSEVRDKAGIFGPDAVKKANADLARVERETGMPVTIETISSLNGMTPEAAIEKVGKTEGIKGLFVLIAAKDNKIRVKAANQYDRHFSRPKYDAIADGFTADFRRNAFDAGLAGGVAKIESTLLAAKSEAGGTLTPAPVAAGRRPVGAQAPAPARPKSDFTSLIGIVVVVIGLIIVVKIIGGIFSAATRGGQPGYGGPGGMMRGPGQGFGGPGYGGGGPGYGGGGPGYGGGGGRGGGFMSGLLGGVGGAVAGNWLYDKFGRGHQAGYGGTPADPGEAGSPDAGGDWTGTGSGGADWGDGGGGGTSGGGDWGGGGGGGDWGGGGGGGGGDWGGGGGGDGGGGGW